MTTTHLTIAFPSEKSRRKTLWLIRQFTSRRAFVTPSIELHRERKLTKQYRGDGYATYFPTDTAWDAFVAFARLLQHAEPFASRSTVSDTHRAFAQAFANMLSDRHLPHTVEDFVPYLPGPFRRALTSRTERSFTKLNGATIKFDGCLLVGQCWLGKYANLCLDAVPEDAHGHKAAYLRSIATAFEDEDAFIAGARNPGTTNRVAQEATYQLEIAIAILCVLLNVTYRSAFGRLWQVRHVDRPELGLSNQRSFSIIVDGEPSSPPQLGLSLKFREQWFEIHEDLVATWHDSIGLDTLNRLVTDPAYRDIDLVERLLTALRHFRVAATQNAPEMQMSTLWVCVESLFTRASDRVLDENLPALVATTVSSVPREYWPSRAGTPEELRRVFTRYYRQRSRTLHHGRRHHVSRVDVQEFSLVVASLVIDVASMIRRGVRTADQLRRAARRALDGRGPTTELS